MRMYSSQSICVEVDWSGIELNSIPFHSNTCGLRWIHMHPNKALVYYFVYIIIIHHIKFGLCSLDARRGGDLHAQKFNFGQK